MTTPQLHPSEDLILDYARGALDAGRALVLETHIGACARCRAGARIAEAVGGALLAELPPAEMAPDALERALAGLDRPLAPAAAPARKPADWIDVPPAVLDAFKTRKRWAAPGVWVATVSYDRRTGKRTYLLGIGANIAVPRHSHRGRELTCVLKGAFEDGHTLHAAGDFADCDEAVEHQPRTTTDGECVCLISVDHRLVPRSWTARMLQPFVGI
jgi:putative transcriptional regulator